MCYFYKYGIFNIKINIFLCVVLLSLLIVYNMYIFFSDKNPHINEFVCQIKSSHELNAIYEAIQKDTTGIVSDNHTTHMEGVEL